MKAGCIEMHLFLGTNICVLSLFLSLVRSQDLQDTVFNSLSGLELLLKTERELLLNLENYANALDAKSTVIRSAIAAMRAENFKSIEDAEKYLSNSLNSFALIRRMHTDWIHWELFMLSPVGEAEIDINQELRNNLPSSTDMDRAIVAIYRLQTTYGLQPKDMAAGLLNGKQYDARLSSRDCFEIGKRLLNQEKIFDASHWLYVALMLYQENKVNAILEFNKLQILDLYMLTFTKQYRFDTALELVNLALEYSPNNAKYLREKSLIEHNIKTSSEQPQQYIYSEPEPYHRCCRGVFDNRLTNLHCRYNSTTHPFFKLAPIKMEEVQIDPYIVLYYDVVSDTEIVYLKELTRPYLQPALVYDMDNENFTENVARTSQYSYFEDNTSNTTKRVMQKISDISGFDLQGSESMSVMNYILAAHYSPHHDYFNISEEFKILQGVGDRIATMLIYLSDVHQGGSTVFPHLNIAVHPRKGSALMWYNLNNRGDPDEYTFHASCPVIVGSKWIATKWIRVRPQLFRRKCYA